MTNKTATLLVALVLIALVVAGASGYFVRAGELSSIYADLAKAQESNAMAQEELNGLMAKLQAANESKDMLQEELRARTTPFAFVAESGQMIHDAWLFIAPLGQGKWAVIVRAQGLDNGPESVYLVEGIARKEPMQMVPIGATEAESQFHADQNGVALFWVIVDKDLIQTFEKIVLLLLPGMSMRNAIMVATTTLG